MNSSADNISANVLIIDANNLNKPAAFHKDKIHQAIYTVYCNEVIIVLWAPASRIAWKQLMPATAAAEEAAALSRLDIGQRAAGSNLFHF